MLAVWEGQILYMKKIYAILLCAALLLGLYACGQAAPETESTFASTAAPAPGTTAAVTTTEPLPAPPMPEPTTGQPLRTYLDPEDMNADQALAYDLIRRGWDVYCVFDGLYIKFDFETPYTFPEYPQEEWFRVVENDRGIQSVADLKALAEATYTKEYAQRVFYLEDTARPGKFGYRYYERDGVLYASGDGGVGDPGEWLFETVQVQSRTADTLIFTVDHASGSPEVIQVFTYRLKMEGGAWKLDSGYWGLEMDARWAR